MKAFPIGCACCAGRHRNRPHAAVLPVTVHDTPPAIALLHVGHRQRPHCPRVTADIKPYMRGSAGHSRPDPRVCPAQHEQPGLSNRCSCTGGSQRTGHGVNQVPARKRQTETRTRPPPRFRPKWQTRPSLPRLAIPEKTRIMVVSHVFLAPLTWLTAFRSPYLGRQERRTSESVSGGRL